MIKRFMAAVAVAVLGLVGALTGASPAQAVWSDCAAYSNVVCFHQYPDFTGRVWRQLTGQFPTGCRNFAPESFDNMASTAFNRTSNYQLRVYQGSGCTGSYVFIGPGDVQSFGDTNTWFNNTASSAKITFIG